MMRLCSAKTVIIVFCVALLSGPSCAQEGSKPQFKAVAFDYFVIFDPNSVVPEVDKVFPGKGAEFTRVWRGKSSSIASYEQLPVSTSIFPK
jgi:2-haloacid dehalogenase